MTTKKWITFDLDGTLMQNPFAEWVFPEIVSSINKHLSRDVDVQKMIVDEHRRRVRDNRTLEAYNWDDIVEKVLFDLNMSLKIDVEELVVRHAVAPKVYLLERNVIGELQKMRLMGYALAAVTNGYYKYQYPVMKELGLDKLFDKIITPEMCGYAKPNVKIVDSLMADGKVMAHIGDRIDHDVVLANKLGIRSVWFSRDLPESVLDVAADERNAESEVLALCKEKWGRENDGRDVRFTSECVPDVVSSSACHLPNFVE